MDTVRRMEIDYLVTKRDRAADVLGNPSLALIYQQKIDELVQQTTEHGPSSGPDSEAPLDKAQHLLGLAGVASSLGDFRLAAKLYSDAKKWIRYGELTSPADPSEERSDG